MKIGVLTSSRADYGIYKKLLSKLSKDDRFELFIIAFGMHLLPEHGNTIEVIEKDNFGVIKRISGMPTKDSPLDITKGYGQIIIEFSNFWNSNKFNYVFALGDRFEMSSAVQSGIPFGINFVHLHGGETTLGAIDNIYRHQITLASKIHFVAVDEFVKKVSNITGNSKNIYSVGALSIDGLKKIKLPKWSVVREKFEIPNVAFILVTFHPETLVYEKNKLFSNVVYETIENLCKTRHIVITLSNADTMGSLYRNVAIQLKDNFPNKITLVSNFGKENYFSAMNACEMLLGNTSSGILEAASFGKYVIDVGERQAGRMKNQNVINVPFDKNEIIKRVKQIEKNTVYHGENIYFKPNTAKKIIEILAENGL